MKTIISVIGSTPQITSGIAQKIAGKTGSTIFAIADYRFSQSTSPGHPAELSAWGSMTGEVLDHDSVVLKSSSLSENLLTLHQHSSFDTRILVMSGSAKEVAAAEKLNAGHVIAIGSLNAKEVAESVQKYLLQEKGII
jgi:hypothetical protein